jgi:glutamyl-tRNA synthetase
VLGPDGTRLAKRHGGATLAQRGEAPEVTLAALAHSLGLARGRTRVASPAELLGEFEPGRLPQGDVVIGRGRVRPGEG